MKRSFSRDFLLATLLVLGSFLSPLTAQENEAGGAIAAIGALPPNLINGIVKVSADNGHPNPPMWYILAKDQNNAERLVSVSIADGQIVAQKPSLNLIQLLNASSFINLSDIQIDSDRAYEIAQSYAAANGKQLGSVSYVLQQQGEGAVPTWSIWCYDPSVSYFGMLQILATTGTVISSEGLPQAP